MNFSNERLIELLLFANKKIKKLKSTIKNIRIERNSLNLKLNEIEKILNDINYYYDRYDFPSDREHYELQGQLELKKDLLKIINGDK